MRLYMINASRSEDDSRFLQVLQKSYTSRQHPNMETVFLQALPWKRRLLPQSRFMKKINIKQEINNHSKYYTPNFIAELHARVLSHT